MRWQHIVLDDRVSPVFRPACSVTGCRESAKHLFGHYANEDAQQGEYSKFGGWLYCTAHYIQRQHDDLNARNATPPAPTPQPDTYTLTVYAPCVHCHVRHDPRFACRVLPDGAVLITTNYAS